MLQNFRTYQLALNYYQQCEGLSVPTHLKDQLRRAASSIVLNLAEGSAKPTEKDRKRFYSIALGSYRETQAVLQMTCHFELLKESDHLGACLYKLSRFTRS
ncbi:MAG: four helix bundle protein [Bdellovibrionota bacterium]